MNIPKASIRGQINIWVLICFLIIGSGLIGYNTYHKSTGVFSNSKLTKLQTEPEVKLHEKVEYYTISGKTEVDLQKQMSQKGPRGYGGYASWYLKWSHDVEQKNTICSLKNPKVSLDITITLPKWNDIETAPLSLKEKWLDFENKLIEHELEHRSMSIDGANNLAKKMKSISSSECENLSKEVDTEGARTLNEMRSNDSNFDLETNHGINQGTNFP